MDNLTYENIEEIRKEERKRIAKWLRHVDRLDEIPGAAIGLPKYNPLWDAGMRLERMHSSETFSVISDE